MVTVFVFPFRTGTLATMPVFQSADIVRRMALDTCRTDGAVKHLDKSFLGACIEDLQAWPAIFLSCICNVGSSHLFKEVVFFFWHLDLDICFLMRTVGIEECTGNIDNLFSSPSKTRRGSR